MNYNVFQFINGKRSFLASFIFPDDAILFAREKSKADIGYLTVYDDDWHSLGTFEGGI